MLSAKQRGVLGGMAAGLIVTLFALGYAIASPPHALLPAEGAPAALIQALRWDILLIVWLGANIAILARHRLARVLVS